MNLSEQLAVIQNTLQQLSSQLKDMQSQVQKLEEENERLRQLTKNTNTDGGQKTLQKLYEEGYHVCPTNFGREHDGGCLLCLETLKNATK